jgi:hypothetical protein
LIPKGLLGKVVHPKELRVLFPGLPTVSLIFPMKCGEETPQRQRTSAAKKAWIWIHTAIMREEGEMIGKLGEGFLRVFSAGYGGPCVARLLTSPKAREQKGRRDER